MSTPHRPADTWLERFTRGQTTVVVGAERLTTPSALPLTAVSVHCGRHDAPLGPLTAMLERLTTICSWTRLSPHVALAAELLGQPEATGDSELVATANRAQADVGHPLVLVFESLDEADTDTLRVLDRIVRSEQLQCPLLLVVAELPPTGPLAELVGAVTEVHGRDAVQLLAPNERPHEQRRPQAVELPEGLPHDALYVLRAGVVVGNPFHVDAVADVLRLDRITTLEALQRCCDVGVPLRDLGSGVFRLPAALARDVAAQITPSLLEAWRARVATPEDTALSMASPAPTSPAAPMAATALPEAYGGAGEPTELLAAARRATRVGGHEQAIALLEDCLVQLERPMTNAQRTLRVEVLLELAQIRQNALGGPTLTLDGAMVAAEQARAALADDAPLRLRVRVLSTLARIHYHIGGPKHLQQALELTAEARRLLLDAGRPVEAARLLNDEAAVYVRLGDLAKAAQWLLRSRDIFARLGTATPAAKRELADTDLLAARLVLHAPRADRPDPKALAWAMQCARDAATAYRALGDSHGQARAWETLARVERIAGNEREGLAHLAAALQTQERLRDAVGLSRTLAAVADAMAEGGAYRDALALLAQSIQLNAQKGSRQGLDYNREALDALVASAGQSYPDLRQDFDRLRRRLDEATAGLAA